MEQNYKKHMGKANFEKALNTLEGIIMGIKADQTINSMEIEELQNWCMLQHEHRDKYPFKEIIPKVQTSIEDHILTQEEIDDILWLCKMYLDEEFNPYYEAMTAGIHQLHGIMHGILSDNLITAEEVRYLKDWLVEHDHLETIYPYDEAFSLCHKVLQDGVVDLEEERMLKAFFSDFIDTKSSYNINLAELTQLKKEMNIQGICVLGPNIEFVERAFCFTGESSRMKRSELAIIVNERGGDFHKNVTKQTHYLIVGDEGNPCWAFSCYGRKIQKAIDLRKQGNRIVIAHEVDFWDALV